jgi:hypothetical protein
MENTKPQWLLDAEAALEEFNQSEYAQKSQSKINHETNVLPIWRASGGHAQGIIQGKKNVDSGLWEEIQKLGTKAFIEKHKNTEQYIEWKSKGGKEAVITNHERGNFEKLGKLATERHRKRWLQFLEQMPEEFTRKDLTLISSHKTAYNICNSDLVVKNGKIYKRTS